MAHNTHPKAHVLNPICQDYVYNNACTGAKWGGGGGGGGGSAPPCVIVVCDMVCTSCYSILVELFAA